MKKKRRKGDTNQLAAQLAPLEEQDRRSAAQQLGTDPDYGAIIVDNENLSVPKDIMEADEKRFLGMEPVVLVVLSIILIYIAFIAWQITLMPIR
jgi:hypothetical protein